MEAFEASGEWWLPERPERKIAGTLAFDPECGSTLTLIGTLREWHERGTPLPDGRGYTFGTADMDRAGVYPRIHGLAGSRSVHLEDCFQIAASNVIGGQASETVAVNQAFTGAWFDGEPDANSCTFGLRHFVYWMGESGLAEQHRSAKGDQSVIVTGTLLPSTSGLAGGDTVTVAHQVTIAGDGHAERTVAQDFRIRLEREKSLPIAHWLDVASDLQDLVSIGVNKTASFESMKFTHPDVYVDRAQERSALPIEYFVQWADRGTRSEDQRVHSSDMLFSFRQIGGMRGVERWLDVAAQHRSALGRVMGTRYRKGSYVSDQLLNRAAALESLDRTLHPRGQFEQRMNRCADLAGGVFEELVGNPKKWARVLKNERNNMAHHLDRRALEGSEQLFLADSAYWAFVLCLMRLGKFPDEVFESVASVPSFIWLKQRLHAVLP